MEGLLGSEYKGYPVGSRWETTCVQRVVCCNSKDAAGRGVLCYLVQTLSGTLYRVFVVR